MTDVLRPSTHALLTIIYLLTVEIRQPYYTGSSRWSVFKQSINQSMSKGCRSLYLGFNTDTEKFPPNRNKHFADAVSVSASFTCDSSFWARRYGLLLHLYYESLFSETYLPQRTLKCKMNFNNRQRHFALLQQIASTPAEREPGEGSSKPQLDCRHLTILIMLFAAGLCCAVGLWD